MLRAVGLPVPRLPRPGAGTQRFAQLLLLRQLPVPPLHLLFALRLLWRAARPCWLPVHSLLAPSLRAAARVALPRWRRRPRPLLSARLGLRDAPVWRGLRYPAVGLCSRRIRFRCRVRVKRLLGYRQRAPQTLGSPGPTWDMRSSCGAAQAAKGLRLRAILTRLGCVSEFPDRAQAPCPRGSQSRSPGRPG